MIADCLFTTVAAFRDRKTDFQAVACAWASAVAYVEAHYDEATKDVAENVGGGHEDPAVFGETLEGLRFYGGVRDREYIGTPENPGQIYDTLQKAIDVWRSIGVLDHEVAPADFVAHGVWDE